MAKQRPIRNSELAGNSETARGVATDDYRANAGFEGGPRQRLPLIILFFGVTIGSFIVWSIFGRAPMLDEYGYDLVASYPHDSSSFTQGLIYRDGYLYESSGKYGQSKIRKIKMDDGRIVKETALPDNCFGEGLCAVGDRLIQLTWKENTGFVYDLDLNKIDEFKIDSHGWGLTFDGTHLILSDGTAKLRFLNPETYEVERTVFVRKGATRMPRINELEYINDLIYANVLDDDMVYQISPVDGKVIGRINFQRLLPWSKRPPSPNNEAVMNGIAIRPDTGNLIVTGKNWPKVFEVKLKRLNH